MSDQNIKLVIAGALLLHGLGHGGALGSIFWILSLLGFVATAAERAWFGACARRAARGGSDWSPCRSF